MALRTLFSSNNSHRVRSDSAAFRDTAVIVSPPLTNARTCCAKSWRYRAFVLEGRGQGATGPWPGTTRPARNGRKLVDGGKPTLQAPVENRQMPQKYQVAGKQRSGGLVQHRKIIVGVRGRAMP